MNLRSFLFSLLLAVAVMPIGLAQADLSIDIQSPEDLVIDSEAIVTIEITEDGDPVEVDDITVGYSPVDGVFDDVVYDCNDPESMDNCRANNRGVAGIFEAVFDLKKLPLMVTVSADGVEEEIQLAMNTEVAAEEETLVEEVAAAPVEVAAMVPVETIAPASVQAGPAPTWFIILAPLVLMCAVVMYFVVKTTD